MTEQQRNRFEAALAEALAGAVDRVMLEQNVPDGSVAVAQAVVEAASFLGGRWDGIACLLGVSMDQRMAAIATAWVGGKNHTLNVHEKVCKKPGCHEGRALAVELADRPDGALLH